MKKHVFILCIMLVINAMYCIAEKNVSYSIVDTGQIRCYDNNKEILFPKDGEPFFGQDAHYKGNGPSYRDNSDGTITDLVTGLMWQKSPGEKQTISEALKNAGSCRLGGYKDWRVPNIKELYSLILFSGTDPDPHANNSSGLKPFIDTRYFDFSYGNISEGERIIDSQYASCTRYVSTTMKADDTVFGVNFADGRIKGYGLKSPRTGQENKFYIIYVRGNDKYGKNDFIDNGDGTITDRATGLMWMKKDSGFIKAGQNKDGKLNWEQALVWAENLEFAGYSDWRLPDIKELQSIVDYSRSPDTTKSPAINPIFEISLIKDEGNNKNYPFFWASSTHISVRNAGKADYIAFGEALGWMKDRRTGVYNLFDVHGAGCQRSDPKTGDPSQFSHGHGPQGDVIRIYNFAICVRGGKAELVLEGPEIELKTGSQQGNFQKPSAGQGQQNSRFIDRLDRNGDGKISRDEFDGPRERFGHLDKNGDGYINAEEAPGGPPPGGKHR